MSMRFIVQCMAAAGFVVFTCGGILQSQSTRDREFQKVFGVDKNNLGVKGSNPYFNLTPGYQLSYRHGKETELVTVLDQIKRIDGVDARVVEDREFNSNGKLIERTLDYYAIDASTNDVYYMGEDVDEYNRNGKIKGHVGSWLSGVNGAKFGLMMPASPEVGHRFYQEQAPGIAMDRVEIVSVSATLAVPAGKYSNVVHLVETTPLEVGNANKWYVVGVGAIKDDDMELVKYGRVMP